MARTADKSFWFGARFDSYKKIGRYLRENVSDEEKVFALEVGTIGYYSKKRMIDGSGLISPGYDKYHRKGCWFMINHKGHISSYYDQHQKNGCWLMGIEKEMPDYIVADDISIPYYESIFTTEDSFGKKVVFKKADSLSAVTYPFPELFRNWENFMLEKYGRRNLADWLSASTSLM